MSIAGFDIASSTGICILDGSRVLHLEAWRADISRPKGLGPMEADVQYEAMLAEPFRKHVRELLKRFGVTHAAYEQPRTRDFERKKIHVDTTAEWAGQAIHTETQRASSNLSMLRSFGMCVILAGLCRNRGIECHEVSADEWRKAFLGHARAPKHDRIGNKITDGRKWLKKEVIQQCAREGIIVTNDDAGDAVGVATWLRSRLSPLGRAMAGDLFSHQPNPNKKDTPF